MNDSELHQLEISAFRSNIKIVSDTPIPLDWGTDLIAQFGGWYVENPDFFELRLWTSRDRITPGLYYREELVQGFEGFTEASLASVSAKLEIFLARELSPKQIFLHSGGVSIDEQAVLFVGTTRAGKSYLTNEFIRRGAAYLSDDCVVLHSTGGVSASYRPIKLRVGDRNEYVDLESKNRVVGQKVDSVGVILDTYFVDGGTWNPAHISVAEMSFEMAKHLFYRGVMLNNPEVVMKTLTDVSSTAIRLKGHRGEAIQVVEDIFDRLRS